MVPRILTDDQKQRRLHILSDLLRSTEGFDRVITGDETWCFNTTRIQKDRACSGKHGIYLARKKARISRSQVKTMLVCFLDHKRIVHYEIIAQG
jgi:hypothetical protein